MAGINLSGIRYIYEARLEIRAVLVQEVFAILGIAVGVALLFASQVSSTSLTHSVAQLNSQLVGSAQVQLEARGPEGAGERLLGEVRRIPGVQGALPVYEHQMNLIGPKGERSIDLIGVDPRSLRTSGPLLRRFSAKQLAAQEAIALPAPLARAIGAGPLIPVKLQIGANFVETLVGATLEEADIGGLVHSPLAVTSIGYAQRLAGARGKISRVFVRFEPAHASQARAALTRLAGTWNVNLVPGQFDARLFAVAVAPESKSETLFSGISALVGFMFALNAMLVTVPSRRKLIEDVRPHGATRWDTVKILLFDAFVIGTVACAIGLLLGNFLSVAVFHTTPGYLTIAFPIGNSRVVTWQSIALAVTAGMTAAVVGVLWPVRQIIVRPATAPQVTGRTRTSTTARFTVGIVCLAITAVALVPSTQAAIIGNIALVTALVVLLPLLFDLLVGLLSRLSDIIDGVGSALAVTELQTPQTRVRSLAIAATAAVAVFGVVEFQGTQTNLERGLANSTHGTDSTANIWVLPGGSSNIQPISPFKAINTTALAHLHGVTSVSIYRGSFLNWGKRRLWVLGPAQTSASPVPAGQVVSGNSERASARLHMGGWAVLSQSLAAEHHLSVGQSFTLPSPRPMALRVAALTTNLGWPPGALILSSSDYAQAWTSSEPSAYQIQTAADSSPVTVRNLIRDRIASDKGLVVETSDERERLHRAIAAQGLSRLTQIRLLVLIAAMLAVIGAMGAMIWQRRALIAFIKVQGYEEIVLWRWLLCEAAVLLSAGCLAGAVFGIYGQILLSHVLASVTGFPITFDIEAFAAVSSFTLVCAIALAVVALPGYLVVRVPPDTSSPAY